MSRADLDAAVERSAAPGEVQVLVARLREERPDDASRLEEDEVLRDAVVAVAASSRFLTRLLLADPAALDTLADLDTRPAAPSGDVDEVAAFKRHELLRIAARDLIGLDPLEAVGANLSTLADDVLDAAWLLGGDETAGLAVIGMGKLGGCELNYSSDIDVLFVGEGEPRRILEVGRTCFRVDANLRPEGRDGPLTRSLDSFEAYWDRWAHTWEFQALLKSRAVAGDGDLGGRFIAAAHQRVWTRPFGAEELRSMRTMKARSEGEVARKGLAEREVKRGWGGIRDIEFAVQLLQMVHGRSDDGLRSPTTFVALTELAHAGYVAEEDARALADAYRFLRTVEHRLQLVEDQQIHAVPADGAARDRLARVLGFRDERAATAAQQFDTALKQQQAVVRSIHQRLFFRPLLEAFSAAPSMDVMPADALSTRLAAFGFASADRTRQALQELTRGLTRSSRMMQQLLPLLLDWLSQSPDPDLGLLGFRRLATGRHRAEQLVVAFRESPEAARRLCLLLGTSRLLADTLERAPDLVLSLGRDEALARHDRATLVAQARAAAGWRDDPASRHRTLVHLARTERFRIAARDVLRIDDVSGTGASVTALAEAVLDASLALLDPPVPMAVIALGRFGGSELSYASDLDVLLVHGGDGAVAEEYAEQLLRFVSGRTPAERLFLMDADLRPEGKDGRLSRSLDGYREYYDRWAQTWERQALLRARPVAGDPELGRRFMELIDPFVWRGITAEEERDIRRMKARVERERIPPGDDPQFHLKLGRGSLSDVEWTAQLLQLRHGVRAPGTIAALTDLEMQGLIHRDDAIVLRDAYRFCERTRNRWHLVKGAPGDALPSQADQLAKLARSLDTDAAELRDSYRRVTRRSRAVMERLFYGRPA